MSQLLLKRFLFAFILITVNSSHLYANSIFTIKNIVINNSGKNATEAREIGVKKAQEEAFQQLLKKIAPQVSYEDLPLSEDKSEIANFSGGIQINSEKVVGTHYRANVDISFNPVSVTKFLEQNNINYIASKSPPHIIIGFVIDENYLIINNEKIRLKLQEEIEKKAEYINYNILSFDDLEANLQNYIASITSPQNIFADKNLAYTEIEKLFKKHNTQKIYLVSFTSNIIDSEKEIIASRLIEINPENIINLQNYTGNLEEILTAINNRFETAYLTATGNNNLNKKLINAVIPTDNDLVYWNKIYNELQNISDITSINITSITSSYVSLNLKFDINFEQLVNKLASRQIYLRNDNNVFILSYSGNNS